MRVDFEHFYKAFNRYVETATDQGVTLNDILIEYRDGQDAPIACFFGEKDGKEMDGWFGLKVSTTCEGPV